MYVYAVSVLYASGCSHINAEAYKSLAAAHDFCETRADKPIKVSDYLYQSKDINYLIHPLRVN